MHEEDIEIQEPMVLSNYRYNRVGGVDADRTLPSGEVVPYTLQNIPQGVEIAPNIPPLPEVPQQVTMRQARLALLQTGLLSAVESAFESLEGDAKTAALIEWEYAAIVQRDAEWMANMTQALNLDDEAIDGLFIAAASL